MVGGTFGNCAGGAFVLWLKYSKGLMLSESEVLMIAGLIAAPVTFAATIGSVMITALVKVLIKRLGGNPDDVGGGS